MHSLRRRWLSLASPMTTIQYVPVPKLSPPFLSCHRPGHSFLYLSALPSLPIRLILPHPPCLPPLSPLGSLTPTTLTMIISFHTRNAKYSVYI